MDTHPPLDALGDVEMVRAALKPHFRALIDVLIGKALSGDLAAAQILMERAVPPLCRADPPVKVDIPSSGGIAAYGASVLHAAFAGSISPGDAAHLLNGVASMTKFVEADQLTVRIAALEQKSADVVAPQLH